jgi:hypothetical protein
MPKYIASKAYGSSLNYIGYIAYGGFGGSLKEL